MKTTLIMLLSVMLLFGCTQSQSLLKTGRGNCGYSCSCVPLFNGTISPICAGSGYEGCPLPNTTLPNCSKNNETMTYTYINGAGYSLVNQAKNNTTTNQTPITDECGCTYSENGMGCIVNYTNTSNCDERIYNRSMERVHLNKWDGKSDMVCNRDGTDCEYGYKLVAVNISENETCYVRVGFVGGIDHCEKTSSNNTLVAIAGVETKGDDKTRYVVVDNIKWTAVVARVGYGSGIVGSGGGASGEGEWCRKKSLCENPMGSGRCITTTECYATLEELNEKERHVR